MKIITHFCNILLRHTHRKRWHSVIKVNLLSRNVSTSSVFCQNKLPQKHMGKVGDEEGRYEDDRDETRLSTREYFNRFEEKTKEAFLDAIGGYEEAEKHRRGHVEFIYAALKYMKEFGVERDLEIYKKLVDILPKGKFIPQNVFQFEFMHFPKQQQCIIDLLEQMEDHGVMPDDEMGQTLKEIFGKSLSHPQRKYMRMMYWMPKFKNLSPWLLPNPVPTDSLELAKLAMQRIGSVDLQTEVEVFDAGELEDSIDGTWIVSAQSQTQRKLIAKHSTDKPIYVEGAFRIYLRKACLAYFILRAEPEPKPQVDEDADDEVGMLQHIFQWKNPFREVPKEKLLPPVQSSVHEQEDGVILAACATGTSSKDSLLSWIRFLQQTNPRLGDIPVVFSFHSPLGSVVPIELPKDEPEPPSKAEEDVKRLHGGVEGDDPEETLETKMVNFKPIPG